MSRSSLSGVPIVTTTEMAEIDRVMIEDLGISLLQMMENAGRLLAHVVISRYQPGRVTVVAGSGGNGGGGRAAARHLHNRGVDVCVVETRPIDGDGSVAAAQAGALEQMGIPVVDEIPPTDVLVDAIIGYSLHGAPHGRAAGLIEAINSMAVPVVALDVPSGLDAEAGSYFEPHVNADLTMTLALPKLGLATPESGAVVLADISVPAIAYARIGVDVSPRMFGAGSLRFLR